ncbi:hypothetical protein DSO57_1037960 [Entomophthora muscae]|uniref:Uncharacterized protein n=1 Tax=Entomophthora muscae TaxID=34485 RepID=A0ACC2UKS9_9FUNG|nr:hypothetical protein DSO57_1037960 [Entomophthora muscae]
MAGGKDVRDQEANVLPVEVLVQPVMSFSYSSIVATKFPSSPANVSYNTQGALNELPIDVSNGIDQSNGNIELWALPPN